MAIFSPINCWSRAHPFGKLQLAARWHTAPVRQLVVTLSGTLDFEIRGGQHFQLAPGDILLAEDTVGGGHSWKLVDEQPWRRVYIVLAPDAPVPFKPLHGRRSG
jgi:quercetin dioxygenase-like cupin family protein